MLTISVLMAVILSIILVIKKYFFGKNAHFQYFSELKSENSNGLAVESLINSDEHAPCEPAHPDDQGPYSTCTRHALSKGTVDGYEGKNLERDTQCSY